MAQLKSDQKLEEDISIHIFTVSAGMVGVCLTVIGLLRVVIALRKADTVAIVRLEQLYPFPHDEFQAQVDLYANAKSVVWAQEEPGNQGAWHRIQHYLLRHLLPHQKLFYAGRESSASPAAGYKQLHDEQQKALVEQALVAGTEPRGVALRPLLAGEDH